MILHKHSRSSGDDDDDDDDVDKIYYFGDVGRYVSCIIKDTSRKSEKNS
jgi:hypothetical protein